ncbi:DUF4262 domain-containing protein [Adhaeribacter soli]|uniref:DUF4262 domain-containing protein n=1 Tax=Adhaeribacter soli TaxID=2607655 RepID=A0A5N1ISH0_9BACT|nr:DUF4262 domain-containing protein [Adhaeribacter soli]KAA9331903.1 DUF4262 domain-containing protein [Adhaeribacter soli]
MRKKQPYNEAIESIINADIENDGCHMVLVEADDYLPAYAYTIGLFPAYHHPEIICFGLAPEVLRGLLKDALQLVKQGKKLIPGYLFPEFLKGFNTQFLKVNPEYYASYFGLAQQYYGFRNFPALQLVWPDKQNHFPWEKSFNPDWKFRQPLLDRNTDFKFLEERDVRAFTTRQVLEGQAISYVYHNNEGDWQFMSDSKPNAKDARIVCLEDITRLDPSVNDIYFLPFGWYAWRNSREEKWTTAKLPEE